MTAEPAPDLAVEADPASSSSRSSSPPAPAEDTTPTHGATAQKKKKKKKPKKPKAKQAVVVPDDEEDARPPVLCISRNKHWRYISSYHGPWLQLPVELLESLLVLNMDPATMQVPETRSSTAFSTDAFSTDAYAKPYPRMRDRGFASVSDHSPPDSPHSTFASIPSYPPLPTPQPGHATPPPIDPGVFRSVAGIRKLIDEASELSVRASSGLSAAALGSMRSGGSPVNNSPWAIVQSLGLNPLGENGGGGRNVAMSAMRIHRLRALAVQKLAAAYRADEIASSVMVMQGGSVFDDIAERVLKVDPHDADAQYVHFFHEKIPSRQLAESTSTQVLDDLIAAYPQRLELFRTRGIVHTFRDEYALAVKDFTHALKEARAVRKARTLHRTSAAPQAGKGNKKKKAAGKQQRTHGQAPPAGTNVAGGGDGSSGGSDEGGSDPLVLHPSVLPDAPEPIEPQVLFLRGAAYLQHAVFLIEDAVLRLEGVRKAPAADGGELRLCHLAHGAYGGVEVGNPDGPLGRADGAKARAYRGALAAPAVRAQVGALVRKAMRDHERFLAHFDALEVPQPPLAPEDLPARAAYAFQLAEALRPGAHAPPPPPPPADRPPPFTTYHPLLVEAHFSILLCHLLLGDFPALVRAFVRTAAVVDGLEGYPVFLPPRSMAQAEFVEILERLAGGWRAGVQPHSFAGGAARNGKLAIEAAARAEEKPEDEEEAEEAGEADEDDGSASSSSIQTPVDPHAPSTSTSTSSAGPSSQPTSGRATPASAPHPNLKASSTSNATAPAEADVAAERAAILDSARANGKSGGGGGGGKKKTAPPLSIPLHGPRVEVVLAWLGAVCLVELEGKA
ncbi:hypothetical protein OF83DRAFT_1278772 [Amylostereum chailletii]|nr:hypothetical protein OF83DRAFT_1278772 [Amylostereum chailletii]